MFQTNTVRVAPTARHTQGQHWPPSMPTSPTEPEGQRSHPAPPSRPFHNGQASLDQPAPGRAGFWPDTWPSPLPNPVLWHFPGCPCSGRVGAGRNGWNGWGAGERVSPCTDPIVGLPPSAVPAHPALELPTCRLTLLCLSTVDLGGELGSSWGRRERHGANGEPATSSRTPGPEEGQPAAPSPLQVSPPAFLSPLHEGFLCVPTPSSLVPDETERRKVRGWPWAAEHRPALGPPGTRQSHRKAPSEDLISAGRGCSEDRGSRGGSRWIKMYLWIRTDLRSRDGRAGRKVPAPGPSLPSSMG
ncbi:uncharacterized protein LOC119710449 [Motacilla alba alba]|uniref:uncharacterized protein LOC119710449 n=1 Tax=Motacilla alba alba TaxID=1094192 RepID=UPI0018D4E627|nr:uncharacterized protein LOC119710449 [Motacilla alba alba]